MAGVDIPRWMWALADDYPFAQPPPGVKPNFENPSLSGYHSITIASSIGVVMLVFFGSIRLYSKLKVIRKSSLDDYFFWMSLPMLLLVHSCYMYLDNNGAYGYHAWEVKIRSLTKPLLVVTFIQQIILPATIWLIKATLIFLILGAFRPVKWLRVLCWIGLGLNLVFYTTNFVIQVVSCRPRGGTDRVSFLAGMASRQCAGTDAMIQKMAIATGIYGVISDLYILIIPLPAVAKLQISKRKKLGVYLIFGSGALACVASILSLIFRVQAFGTNDLTVDAIPNMTCFLVELTVGLCLTCIAPAAKLVRHMTKDNSATLVGSENSNSYARRRKHTPGGLSELDSLKTFGTTIDAASSTDSCSLKQPSIDRPEFSSKP